MVLVQLTGALLQLGVKHPFLIQLKGQDYLTGDSKVIKNTN